jgi:predicted lipoprotein with Yx(FWY)xxD motif
MRWLRGIAAFAAVGLLCVACSSGSSAKSGVKASTTTSSAGNSTTGESSTGTSTVSVIDNSKYGKLLVGPNGHTLYLFEKDTGTTTACTAGCAAIWPGLSASGAPSAGSGVDASKLSTATGDVPNQVVYNGHLLYYFSGDQATNDVKGTSIKFWYPVAPSGKKIDND